MPENPQTMEPLNAGNDLHSLAQYVGIEPGWKTIQPEKVNPSKVRPIESIRGDEPTDDELKSASAYQNLDYDVINGHLRNKEAYHSQSAHDYMEDKTSEHINNLDSLISKQQPLAKDTVVYRGVSDNHPTLSTRKVEDPDALVGAEIQDKGFVSTTKSPKKANDFSSPNGALFRITLPAGTKALDFPALVDAQEKFSVLSGGNPRKSGFQREQELLLPRSSRFKITGYNKEANGRIIWNVNLIH